MKSINLLVGILVFTLTVTTSVRAADEKLAKPAKIDRAKAEAIAMERVPGGKMIEGELEREHGQLVWSFDIAETGSKEIIEVLVNATTGKIVDVSTESPSDQAKERATDKANKHS